MNGDLREGREDPSAPENGPGDACVPQLREV